MYECNKHNATHDVCPLKAPWCMQLKPLLLQTDKSELFSNSNLMMSSFFFVIASCNGVSPSESHRLGCAPNFNKTRTTSIWPLFTPMCKAVWRRLFLAFRSQFDFASNSITIGWLPKAEWCKARSPSLSWKSHFFSTWRRSCPSRQIDRQLTSISRSALKLSKTLTVFKWPFWQAACNDVCPANVPSTFPFDRLKILSHFFASSLAAALTSSSFASPVMCVSNRVLSNVLMRSSLGLETGWVGFVTLVSASGLYVQDVPHTSTLRSLSG